MSVGKKLKEIREDADIKQKVAAEKLQVTAGHICNIENEKAYPSLDLFLQMLDLYGVKSYEVLEEEPDYFYYVYGLKNQVNDGKGISENKRALLQSILQQMPTLARLDLADLRLLDSYLKAKDTLLRR